jgi:acetylornithine deacetylase/succinyl-diaminopimelate desuccinylase-like protein
VTAEFWPGIPVIPIMSTGATDGTFLRNVGIPVYGTSALAGDIDDVRAHGRDERVLIKILLRWSGVSLRARKGIGFRKVNTYS